MSNLIGALQLGSTMIGADPDVQSLRGGAQGGTQITAGLYVSMRARVTVTGATVIIADLQFRGIPRVRFNGSVSGGTVIVYKAPVRKEILLFGEVGAAVAGSLLRHGQVQVLDATRPQPRADFDQRVLPRVPYYT